MGSLRAARFIAKNRSGSPEKSGFEATAKNILAADQRLLNSLLSNENNVEEQTARARRRMSEKGGAIRNEQKIAEALKETKQQLESFENFVGARGCEGVAKAFRLRDTLVSQLVYLSAMEHYAKLGGVSRGSYICCDKDGILPEGLEEQFRFSTPSAETQPKITEVLFNEQRVQCEFSERLPRPLPQGGGFFENVWRDYRKNGNVY